MEARRWRPCHERMCGAEAACRSGCASSMLSLCSRKTSELSIGRGGGSGDARHTERVALHDTVDEISHAKTICFRITRDFPDRRLVEVLHPTTDGVGHQVLRERANEWRRALEQRALQLVEIRDRSAVVELTTRVERR